MNKFSVILKEIKPQQLGGITDLILEKINDAQFKDEFNENEKQWVRDHAPKIPLFLKNKNMCRVLLQISKEESLTRYEIASKLDMHYTQVYRITKKLESELKLVYLNGRTGGFSSGRPCYVNRDVLTIIHLLKALIEKYHGTRFIESL